MTPAAEALGTTRTAIALYDTIRTLVMAGFQFIAAILYKKYNPRLITAIAAIFCGLGSVVIGLMKSVAGWYVGAVISGIGLSCVCYIMIPVIINNWFHKKMGFAAGFGMAFSGLGGAVFASVSGNLIVNYSWSTAITIVGVIGTAISLFASIVLLRGKPEEKQLLPYGYDPNETTKEEAEKDMRGFTAKEALTSILFWVVLLSIMLIYFYGSFMIHIASYAISVGFDVLLASRVSTTMMLGLVAGKLLLGVINDKFGGLGTMIASCIMCLIGIGILFASHGGATMVFIATFIIGMSEGGLQLTPALLVRGAFGNKDYGKIYSYTATAGVLVSAFGAPLYANIYESTGSYNSVLVLAASGMILASVLNCIVYKPARKKWAVAEA